MFGMVSQFEYCYFFNKNNNESDNKTYKRIFFLIPVIYLTVTKGNPKTVSDQQVKVSSPADFFRSKIIRKKLFRIT
jgi:hypothetical protein